MKIANAYQQPSGSVPIYLDRYTAQRLLLALTQALEPGGGKDYYKKKTKKGKGWGLDSGMKLTKKGYKSAPTYGMKLSKSTPTYGMKLSKEPVKYAVSPPAPKPIYGTPLSPKSNLVPPKTSYNAPTLAAEVKEVAGEVKGVAQGLVKGVEAFAKALPKKGKSTK